MQTIHCVKSAQIRSFFRSVFSRNRTKYGSNVGKYGPEKTPYLGTLHAVIFLLDLLKIGNNHLIIILYWYFKTDCLLIYQIFLRGIKWMQLFFQFFQRVLRSNYYVRFFLNKEKVQCLISPRYYYKHEEKIY